MTGRWGDLATRSHAFTGPGMPELVGSAHPVGEQYADDVVPDKGYTYPVHDYTYGLSKRALRPTGPFPETPPPRKPRPPAGKRRMQPRPAPVYNEPVYTEPVPVKHYVTSEPVLYPPRPTHTTQRRRNRYTVSHPVVVPVSRNDFSVETMLSDLLEGSQ